MPFYNEVVSQQQKQGSLDMRFKIEDNVSFVKNIQSTIKHFDQLNKPLLNNIVTAIDFKKIHNEAIPDEVSEHSMFYLSALQLCINAYFTDDKPTCIPEGISVEGLQKVKTLVDVAYSQLSKRPASKGFDLPREYIQTSISRSQSTPSTQRRGNPLSTFFAKVFKRSSSAGNLTNSDEDESASATSHSNRSN